MEIKITSPEKVLFVKDGITKLDLMNYYISVAPLMLPYVENRLLSVIRCHDNVDANVFFKKHPNSDNLVHVKKVEQHEYFYIKTAQELVNQVQLGTVEFHTWASSVDAINKPDVMVFDLDPDTAMPLKVLREAVLKIKFILDELEIDSFLKTSGGKGYHVVAKLPSKNWQQFEEISKQIAMVAQQKWPQIFTTNIRKERRKGKVFVDFLRNKKGATCVAPYSVRARAHAPISMPILWEDLGKISPNEVTINNFAKYQNTAWKTFNNASCC